MVVKFISGIKFSPALVAVIAMALVFAGWYTDRYFLDAKIQAFEFSIGTQTLADHYEPLVVRYGTINESLTIETRVTPKQLAKCPTWNANAGDPPVSARKAISLANAASTEIDIWDETNWKFQNISLSQLDTGGSNPGIHWCWKAHYNGGGYRHFGDGWVVKTCDILVLFDGSVITPKVIQNEPSTSPSTILENGLLPSNGQLK